MVEVGKLIEKEVTTTLQPWIKTTSDNGLVSYHRHDTAGICVATAIEWGVATKNPTWKWTVHDKKGGGETALITEALEAADAALRKMGYLLLSNEDEVV